MRIAVTGATGFLGRYIVNDLAAAGHKCRCWKRAGSDQTGFAQADAIEWLPGALNDADATEALVRDCDAVVHSALFRPGAGWRGAEGDVIEFAEKNLLGSLRLMQAARRAGVHRFVFISTCAVHEKILDDRPLNEAHPLWPSSHYGAHKAAIEKFVHSYGLGEQFPICALRPTGIYGRAQPAADSKWFDLVRAVANGESVSVERGGKEVHAADVARATRVLLDAPPDQITGTCFNCYDRYISEYDVAHAAKRLSGSNAEIVGEQRRPKHEIETGTIRALGMEFGGEPLLEQTVRDLLTA